jgi:two-component system, NarL family, response regulator DevR
MRVRVLLVDDASVFRRAAREVLTARGYVVVGEAETVHDAIESGRRLRPDAALVDLRLPDGSGLDVAAALTSEQPDLAVVLVTADSSEPNSDELNASGARGFVQKSRLATTDFTQFW